MGYSISLIDPASGSTRKLDAPHYMRGSTYAIGGTTDAALDVTYNYSPIFRRTFGDRGIRAIYGMTGAASIPVLDAAIAKLGGDVDADYWKATEGNARQALKHLRELARMCPDGVWSGD